MAASQPQALDGILTAAGKQIADSLGLAVTSPLRPSVGIPSGKEGAFISLIGDSISIQVAVLADTRSIQRIARALLCMESSEPDLDADDAADAICEIANQFGGIVKRSLISTHRDLRIGLPLMVKGEVSPPAGVRVEVAHSHWGGMDVWLLALMPEQRRPAEVGRIGSRLSTG